MRGRVWLIAIPLVIVSLVVTLNMFFYRSYQAEMATEINRQQLIIAKTIAASIQDNVEHYGKELEDFTEMLATRGMTRIGMDRFLEHAFTELNEDLSTVAEIYAPDGTLILSTLGAEGKISPPALIDEALGLEPHGLFYHDASAELGRLFLGSPIHGPGGRLMGAMLLAIDINDINDKYLRPVRTGHGGYAWMMNRTGSLIYHPSESAMIGRNILHNDGSCYDCHVSFETEREILADLGTGSSSYLDPRGEDKLLSYSWIEPLGWAVFISIPYSTVTASVSESVHIHSLLVIVISMLTVMGATIIIYINRERVKAESKAAYADKIAEYAHALEAKVEERTQELRTEKEKLDAVVSSVGAGICIFDREGRCMWRNRVLTEWMIPTGDDEPADSGSGLDIVKIIGTGPEALARVSEGKQINEARELRFPTREGWFQVTVTSLRDPGGEALYLMLIQDVTNLKRAEERLIRSEKLISMARLSAGVAHEIGNPLTTISSYIQILRGRDHDGFTSEALTTIGKQVMRIDAIIKKMADFSRERTGELDRHALSDVIQSALELVRYDKRTRNMTIEQELPLDLPRVYVNDNQLVQVFVNLMLNAADATDEHGRITIRSARSGGFVDVMFIDNGPGIDRDSLDRLFDPFYTTKDNGTGLGLSVSYGIVRSFGGELMVDTSPGGGTTFRVRLPSYE